MNQIQTSNNSTSTTFTIGFECIDSECQGSNVTVDSILKAMARHKCNRLDILVAGMSEIIETRPCWQAVAECRELLAAVANLLDEAKE